MGISFDLNNFSVQSVNLTYSRDAYIPSAVVVGDRIRIETTLLTENTGFTDNIELTKQWNTGLSPTKAQKQEDGTTTDIYSRFAIESDTINWDTVDNLGDIENTRVEEYKEFTTETLNYSGDEKVSASAWIEVSTGVWERSGETAGLQARVSNENISYLKFQAGDRGKEFDNKDKRKAYTGVVKGSSRILVQSGNFSEEEFIPFIVDTTDRFKAHRVYKSYRTIPSGTATNTGLERDDTTEAQSYADNLVENNTVPTVDGTFVQNGSMLFLGIGTQVDSFITRNGDTIDVGLSMIDISDGINPIKSGSVIPDTTTIRLGRV